MRLPRPGAKGPAGSCRSMCSRHFPGSTCYVCLGIRFPIGFAATYSCFPPSTKALASHLQLQARRESFFEKLEMDPSDAASWDKMGAFCAKFSDLLAQAHQFLDSNGLDDPTKV